MIDVQLVLDLPLDLEPGSGEGVCTMALRCTDEGTLAHPGSLISELLEDQGAVYSGQTTLTASTCEIEVSASRVGPALELFTEIVTTPAFDPGDVTRHRALRLAQIEQAHANPSALASLAIRRALFHPASRASRPSGGSAATVATLDADTVAAFHHTQWGPTRGTLIIAGALPEGILDAVEATLGRWQARTEPVVHTGPLPRTDAPRVMLVDRPGSVQADLRIGSFGIDRTHPDWAAIQLACAVMGGTFGSRLNLELRERRGLTYGASLSPYPLRGAGSIVMGASVRTEAAAEATTVALDLLRADPFTAAEVTDARNYLVGVAPLRNDTSQAVASQAGALAGVGLGPEFVDAYYSAVRQVDVAQATEAFRRHVADRDLTTVLVGDAAVLGPQLAARGLDAEVVDADSL